MTDTAALSIIITAPTTENATAWADTIYDLVHAEHGDHMRLDISVNPPNLPHGGHWQLTRGGTVLHTTSTQAEAQAVGLFAIRQELGDPRLSITWVCPACYGDDQECQDCSEGRIWYLSATGVLTDAEYAVQRVVPSTSQPA